MSTVMEAETGYAQSEIAERWFEAHFNRKNYQKHKGSILKLRDEGLRQGQPNLVEWVKEKWQERLALKRRAASTDALREKGFEPVARPMGSGQNFGSYIHVLNRRERQVILQHYEDGEPLDSIAESLRVSVSEVREIHTIALGKLREEIRRLDTLDAE